MRGLIAVMLVFLLSDACVDRISFDVGKGEEGVLVVEGGITDQPGPYVVHIFRTSDIYEDLRFDNPLLAKRVLIMDDQGNSEELQPANIGYYATDPNGIRGVIGRKYRVRVELLDGTTYESQPDVLKPVGDLDSLYWAYETFQPSTAPTQHGFRIFVDAQDISGFENYLRWRFVGVYSFDQCYIYEYEKKPHVNDNNFVEAGEFKHVEVGYVEINEWTFNKKYQVNVEQMSLTKTAFDYWKTIQDQKNGATSLFQPAFGKLHSNLFEINGKKPVQGIFYASAVKEKKLFLTQKDVPFSVPAPLIPLKDPCVEVFVNATYQQPPDWN